jgi:UDP-2,3-diacylglucosamine pyrophosphatase LpxH
VNLLRIASDWHLSPRSPPLHGRLVAEFLRRAREDDAAVVLNGDVFDDLFEGAARCRDAHPEVIAGIEALRARGRLRRTCGNHDPGAGEERVLVDWPGVGRVLVAHGHAADPLNRSWLGRLGDGISRRFGRVGLVRGAAALAEAAARTAAGGRIAQLFRARCLAMVEREGCDLGVFGHVHEPHLAAGDRYANAGSLAADGLHFLELGSAGPRLCRLTPEELAAGRRGQE